MLGRESPGCLAAGTFRRPRLKKRLSLSWLTHTEALSFCLCPQAGSGDPMRRLSHVLTSCGCRLHCSIAEGVSSSGRTGSLSPRQTCGAESRGKAVSAPGVSRCAMRCGWVMLLLVSAFCVTFLHVLLLLSSSQFCVFFALELQR